MLSLIFLPLIFLNVLQYSSSSYVFEKCTSQSSLNDSKVVQTLNGPIRGECYNVPVSFDNGTRLNYDIFAWFSIPFAEPPTGKNRFLKPKPIKNWVSTRDAFELPNVCDPTSIRFSEDCLYLNVFIRSNSFIYRKEKLRPILIWIHGGAFKFGGTNADAEEPSTLVAISDIIVVTIQYRLGLFGFFYHSDINNTGNAGFLDQHMAIKWVYDNAELFGGDKTKITLAGVSAGSFLVSYHLFYQPSWSYFRNSIMESGSPLGLGRLKSSVEATSNAKNLFTAIGCYSNFSQSSFECAQNYSISVKIYQNQSQSFDNLVIDNVEFKASIDDLVKSKLFKRCNVITGFEESEHGFFLRLFFTVDQAKNIKKNQFIQQLNIFFKAETEKINKIVETYFNGTSIGNLNKTSLEYFEGLIRINSDRDWICPTFELAEVYTAEDKKAYVYEHAYSLSSSKIDPFYGVVHTNEVAFIFGEAISNKNSSPAFNYSTEEKKLTEKMIKYWTNFVKFDDPNLSDNLINSNLETWIPFYYDPVILKTMTATEKMKNGLYLQFKKNSTKMITGFSSHHCDFWNNTRSNNSTGVKDILLHIKYTLILCFLNFIAGIKLGVN